MFPLQKLKRPRTEQNNTW